MTPAREPQFRERQRDRRRRLTDSARLLPMLGVLLFTVPLLWETSPEMAPGTARGGIYVFLAWGLLIVAAAALARPLTRTSDPPVARSDTPEEADG